MKPDPHLTVNLSGGTAGFSETWQLDTRMPNPDDDSKPPVYNPDFKKVDARLVAQFPTSFSELEVVRLMLGPTKEVVARLEAEERRLMDEAERARKAAERKERRRA